MKRKEPTDLESQSEAESESCDESGVKIFAEQMATLMQREIDGEGEVDPEAPFKDIWEELVRSDNLLNEIEEESEEHTLECSSDGSADSEAEWEVPPVGVKKINPLLNGLVPGEIVTSPLKEEPAKPETTTDTQEHEQKSDPESEESEESEEGSEESESEEEEIKRPVYTNRFALLDSDEEDKPAPKRRKIKQLEVEEGFVQGGGVTTEVLVEGQGDRIVKIGDLVKVNYDGRLKANGKRFDIGDSTFMVGGGDMIIGFDSGIRGMRLHERRRIHIPYKLGYGKKGKKPKIPPNADLIFDVVLNHVGIDWEEKGKVSAVSQARREKMRQRNKKVRKT